jgi:hypothetical protein
VNRLKWVIGEIFRYVMRVGVFAAAGPIVGGLAFVIAASFAGRPDALGLPLLLPLFVVACYTMDWKAALLTGLVVSLIGPWLGPRRMILIVAAIIGAIASYPFVPTMSFDQDRFVVLFEIAGAASATACAWFLDRIQLMRIRKQSAA